MNTDFDSLFKPQQNYKAAELRAIVDTVTRLFTDVEMIVLFGSYATGKWIEDVQQIDGNEFGYKSDFDLLIILHTNAKANNSLYTASIDTAMRSLKLTTPVGAIYHGIDFVNKQINEGSYFFHEIIEQGVMLHNSGRHTLNPIRKLNIHELKAKAERDFEIWFTSGNSSLEMYLSGIEKNLYKEAVFNLHQATERYYAAVQLVFTGYKPKTHDIGDLEVYVNNLDHTFGSVFHRENQREEDYFQLLRRAYVDARYNVRYTITKDELDYIYSRVLVLKDLTQKICQAKIAEIASKI